MCPEIERKAWQVAGMVVEAGRMGVGGCWLFLMSQGREYGALEVSRRRWWLE